MKKHLKYIDGTSDKFWQIETGGNQLTVTYGRNGTSGTSQVKTFDTEEACAQAAEKLLAEKIKKGYSETGEVVATGNPKALATKKEDGLNLLLEQFDDIIKNKKPEALPALIKEQLAGNITAFRKHLNKSKRYWMTYTDLSKEPEFKKKANYNWGTRGDQLQTSMIVMAAIATFDRSSIKSWNSEFYWQLQTLLSEKAPWAMDLLEHSRPDWIIDFYLELVRQKDSWQVPAYQHLVYLEEQGFIQFHPEVYAHSLAGFTNTTHSRHKEVDCMAFILEHPQSYERDVPELFHYETNIANSRNWGGPDDGLRLWHQYFKELVATGKIDRQTVLQKSIEIQTKEWNNGIKTFFRTLVDQLEPAPEELLLFQQSIFPALQNSGNTIVNFAIDSCKKIALLPGFDFSSFMEWVEPALLRTDIKAGIKSLLQVFEKKAKEDLALRPALVLLAAEIFNVPVLELQERAARFIDQYAANNDALLQEKLLMYQPLMLGKVAVTFKDLLPGEQQEAGAAEITSYHYVPEASAKLTQPVQLPQSWNDILFQFGQFVQSDEVIDAELLWNAYATQRHLFPEDYPQQLQPYLKQITKNHYGNEIYCSCYKCASEYYFKTKFDDISKVFTYKHARNAYSPKVFEVSFHLLQKLDEKIQQGSSLPLLSFPSHLPFWVAPKVLLERMIAYQQAGEAIDKTDLSIAISRMPREQVEDAIPLLPQLTGTLQPLMAFCLGVSDTIVLEEKTVMDSIKGMLQQEAETEKTKIASVWAVAARSFYPEKIFEAFTSTYLKEVPFVVRPFEPEITFKEKWNDYIVDYKTREMARTPSWWELHVAYPAFKKIPANLLYAMDMFNRGTGYYYDSVSTTAQANCLWALMPQNNDAYAIKILGNCQIASGGKEGIDVLLTHIPTRPVSYYNYLIWSLGFFNEKKELRAKSGEVLYHQVNEAQADVALMATTLALLVNNKYGVFSRLTDVLLTLKDTTPAHNDALFQLLDGLFSKLTLAALPNQFRKMLEMYYDLLLKTNNHPGEKTIQYLNRWAEQASIKKIIKEIHHYKQQPC